MAGVSSPPRCLVFFVLVVLGGAGAFVPRLTPLAVKGNLHQPTRGLVSRASVGLQLRATGLSEVEPPVLEVSEQQPAPEEIISENAVPSMSFPAPLEAEEVEQITSVGEEPRFSPWISSDRRDEERKLNLAINAAFIFLVVSTVIAKLITVDFDAWRGWTPAEIFLRIPLDNWENYMKVLSAQPVVTKGFTSFSVYLLGDWTAQIYEGKSLEEIDRGRVARSAIAGLIGHGPMSHFWYQMCEGFFTDFLGWTEWWATLPKIFTDQVVWSPIWNGSYILLLGLMKRESLSDVFRNVRTTALPLITSGLKLWPAAHIVTYGLIPVENRLLWVDLVEILWVTILSRQAAAAEELAIADMANESAAPDARMEVDAPVMKMDKEKEEERKEKVMR